MKCNEILEKLFEIMPKNLALSWDNVGLLLGRSDKEVKKIVIALDITNDLIDFAIQNKVDLILTHHPLIFSPLKSITDTDNIGFKALKILSQDISYIAMHTNYDVAPNCMADKAGQILGITGEVLEVTDNIQINGKSFDVGVGKVGMLDKEYSIKELINIVKKSFNIDNVNVYSKNLEEKVSKVAISPGSGKGMYKEALKKGAKLLITGDITHHEGLDAIEDGISIIDASHYGLEYIFIEDMKDKILDINKDIEVFLYKDTRPSVIM